MKMLIYIKFVIKKTKKTNKEKLSVHFGFPDAYKIRNELKIHFFFLKACFNNDSPFEFLIYFFGHDKQF